MSWPQGGKSMRSSYSYCRARRIPQRGHPSKVLWGIFLFVFTLAALCPTPLRAVVREGSVATGFSPYVPSNAWVAELQRYTVLVGGQAFFAGPADRLSVAVALRRRFTPPEGWPPLSIEAGAYLPQSSGDPLASASSVDASGSLFSSRVTRVSEEHVALVGDLVRLKTRWMAPEAALGVSFYQFKNDTLQPIFAGGPSTVALSNHDSAIGLYDRLGVRLASPEDVYPQERWLHALSLLVDAGYFRVIDHSNITGVDHAIKLEGWTLRALVGLRL